VPLILELDFWLNIEGGKETRKRVKYENHVHGDQSLLEDQ